MTIDLDNTFSRCIGCGKTMPLGELFRCFYCHEIYCHDCQNDGYSICPKCDKEEEDPQAI